MKSYYFRHCGSLHPVDRRMIFNEDGSIKDYIPLIGCPTCRKICWLSHVTALGKDENEPLEE